MFIEAKNIVVQDCEYNNKKMGRSGDPFFYMRYYLNFRLETFQALMPNIQIDVGQIKMRAKSIFSSPHPF